MFKIVKPESLLWPVSVDVPRTDGSGETDPHEIKVRYKYLGVDEWQKLLSDDNPDDQTKVRDYIMGWADLSDDNGELEFKPETLEMIMDIPYLAIAINKGFFECQSGSRSKN